MTRRHSPVAAGPRNGAGAVTCRSDHLAAVACVFATLFAACGSDPEPIPTGNQLNGALNNICDDPSGRVSVLGNDFPGG